MTTLSNIKKYCAHLSLLLLLFNCSSDPTDDPIPYVPFTPVTININLPQYFALQQDRGFVQINGGVKGLIIYRVASGTFRAFERNCSFQPNDACATVEVHPTQVYMHDPCCNSMFNFEGNPIGGPAWRPLRQYQTFTNGFQLTITDDASN